MGSFSIWHWMVVLLVVLLLFGSGKVSGLMGDFAKGIKSFKKNMADDSDASMEASTDHPNGTIAPPAVGCRRHDHQARDCDQPRLTGTGRLPGHPRRCPAVEAAVQHDHP